MRHGKEHCSAATRKKCVNKIHLSTKSGCEFYIFCAWGLHSANADLLRSRLLTTKSSRLKWPCSSGAQCFRFPLPDLTALPALISHLQCSSKSPAAVHNAANKVVELLRGCARQLWEMNSYLHVDGAHDGCRRCHSVGASTGICRNRFGQHTPGPLRALLLLARRFRTVPLHNGCRVVLDLHTRHRHFGIDPAHGTPST